MHPLFDRARLLTVALCALIALPAIADDMPEEETQQAPADASLIDQGRIVVGGRFSADVQEAMVDALIPLWMQDETALFLNLRGTFLEGSEQEANAGVVVRHYRQDPGVILGMNLFYDQRWTANDNRFDQLAGGVEALSRWVDLRANYYYPLKDETALDDFTTSTTATSGGRRVTTVSTFRQFEEALQGWDAELGVWFPGLERFAPTALYVGYYDFDSDRGDDVSGWKLRVESRLCRQLTLDAEWYETAELNRSDYFVGFRVHLPLDFWNGVRLPRGEGFADTRAARMNEMVRRDSRIRTQVSQPVLIDERVESTSAGRASTAPASSPITPLQSAQRPTAAPPPPPPDPNCFIDPLTGEVICR